MGSTQWNAERDAKRQERANKQLQRAMLAPIPRAEMYQRTDQLLQNVSSVAFALEALDLLLVEKGILKENELLDKIKALVESKAAQVAAESEAAQAVAAAEPSRIIIPT